MNRRNFLRESAGLLMGSFFGLNSFSKAFAVETHPNHTVGQPRIALIIDNIGHPFKETVHAIGRFIKNIKNSDISLVHVSDVL